MKTLPIILTAAMALSFVSCIQTPPEPLYNGNGALAPAALGDPLSAPQGAPAPTPAGFQTPPPTPTPTPSPTSDQINHNPNDYPYAVKTPEADIVLSPYKPYNKVRVDPKKFKSGDLAQDPDSKRIFRVP